MLLLPAMILMGIAAFAIVIGVGVGILHAYAFIVLRMPRGLYWLRSPFIALMVLLSAGWLAPFAAVVHPSGPKIAIVTLVVGVIGGDLWHHWRGKPGIPEPIQYEQSEDWE
jgi:hypothetical protein